MPARKRSSPVSEPPHRNHGAIGAGIAVNFPPPGTSTRPLSTPRAWKCGSAMASWRRTTRVAQKPVEARIGCQTAVGRVKLLLGHETVRRRRKTVIDEMAHGALDHADAYASSSRNSFPTARAARCKVSSVTLPSSGLSTRSS
jgi:hypothetical protein